MSLSIYHKFIQDNDVGIDLPKLTAATIESSPPSLVSAQKVISKINEFSPQQGWISYRDKVEVSSKPPENEYFIEAQYCNGDNSLHIKLISNNQYQVISFFVSPPITNNINSAIQAYTKQALMLRSNLTELTPAKTVNYRLWWQLEQRENNNNFGRWLPLVQQFIGFNNTSAQGEL